MMSAGASSSSSETPISAVNHAINELFKYNSKSIRVIGTPDKPWFCGKDICGVLVYEKERDAITLHVDQENITSLKDLTARISGGRKYTASDLRMLYINEPGLYELIFKSNKPMAKAFNKWVISEVLPSIRKTGGYISPTASNVQITELQAKLTLLTNEKTELSEKMERMIKVNADLLILTKRMNKNETIYIVSSKHYTNQGLFKVGRTKTTMKARLASYNTGRPENDKMLVLAEFKVNDSVEVEKSIHWKCKSLRPGEETELYHVPFNLLRDLVGLMVGNDNAENLALNNIIDQVTQLKIASFDLKQWTVGVPEGSLGVTFPRVEVVRPEPIPVYSKSDLSTWLPEHKQDFTSECLKKYFRLPGASTGVIYWENMKSIVQKETGLTLSNFKVTPWKAVIRDNLPLGRVMILRGVISTSSISV
jgi:prophage antirepressor-like protein